MPTIEEIRAERNAKAAEHVGTGNECPECHGKGSITGVHVWSDGPGMVEYTCDYCLRTGEVGDERFTRQRLLGAERELAKVQGELDMLRTYAGLYIDVLEDRLPKEELDPDRPGYIKPYPGTGYARAHRPPQYPEYYLDRFREAGKKAPKQED